MKAIPCYFTIGGINYKNGFVTSCPQQNEQMYILKDGASVKPSDIINSEKFKKHRLEMMSGTWSPGCHLCKNVEQAGAGESMRVEKGIELNYYNSETGEISPEALKTVELRFSNSCNFACLHCNEVYSSGWVSKLKYYQTDDEDRRYDLDQFTRVAHRESESDNLSIELTMDNMVEIVNDLNANFPNLERVDFAGGEVLYQKQFFPCLELLAKHPNRDNMTIFFHTNFNANADIEKLYNLLKPFGGMRSINRPDRKMAGSFIMLSLDAGKNMYSYFRSGSWEKLKNNIDKYKLLDTDKKTSLNIICTTSAYQIMDLVNVFESFIELDIDSIKSSIVYYPKYLDPALMMYEFSDHVLEDIKRVKDILAKERIRRNKLLIKDKSYSPRSLKYTEHGRWYTDIYSAQKAIENIEQYVKNNTTVERKHYDALKVYIGKSDKLWKQNFNNHMNKYSYNSDTRELIRINNE